MTVPPTPRQAPLDVDRDVRRELKRAGMSARDYLLTTMSLSATSLYAAPGTGPSNRAVHDAAGHGLAPEAAHDAAGHGLAPQAAHSSCAASLRSGSLAVVQPPQTTMDMPRREADLRSRRLMDRAPEHGHCAYNTSGSSPNSPPGSTDWSRAGSSSREASPAPP